MPSNSILTSALVMPENLRLTGRRVYDLYEPTDPYNTGYLALDNGHEMYYEQCGNREGPAVLFLHGGPGAGASPAHRRFFDPEHYRIVIFDQRGAGRSRPLGGLINNTTPALVGDIETLRKHLGIDRWVVFGGSWGSTLALAYAIAHKACVRGLVLRGIFLARKSELEWFLSGVRQFFPDAWNRLNGFLPEAERSDLLGSYYKRLTDPNPAVHMPAARIWSGFEGACSTLMPNAELAANYATDNVALGLARIEAHFFVNGLWLGERELLDGAATLTGIHTVIVQGRYDMVCPPISAVELSQVLPGCEFIMVPDSGHSAFEPGTRAELVAAMERMKALS